MIKTAKKMVALMLVWVFIFNMVPTIYAEQFNTSMETDFVDSDLKLEEETLEPIEINDAISDVLEQEESELEISENIINETIIYDAQPSSIEEVQASIDAYEALPWSERVKPHWQYEVDSSIMPTGWHCGIWCNNRRL